MSQQQTSRTIDPTAHGIRHSLSIADCLTVGNGICGLIAVVTALGTVRVSGHVAAFSHSRLMLCAALIVAGGILDVADGAVARRLGSSGMGTALDTMSDALTFGVAPAALVIAVGASDPTPWRWFVFPVACVLVAASMLRLARFASFPAAPDGGFLGLPMPAAAGAVLALLCAHIAPQVLLAGVLLTSALMVSEIPYPHLDRRTAPFLAAYWVAVAAALTGLLPTWPIVLACLAGVALIPLGAPVRSRVHLLARLPAEPTIRTVVQRQRVA